MGRRPRRQPTFRGDIQGEVQVFPVRVSQRRGIDHLARHTPFQQQPFDNVVGRTFVVCRIPLLRRVDQEQPGWRRDTRPGRDVLSGCDRLVADVLGGRHGDDRGVRKPWQKSFRSRGTCTCRPSTLDQTLHVRPMGKQIGINSMVCGVSSYPPYRVMPLRTSVVVCCWRKTTVGSDCRCTGRFLGTVSLLDEPGGLSLQRGHESPTGWASPRLRSVPQRQRFSLHEGGRRRAGRPGCAA